MNILTAVDKINNFLKLGFKFNDIAKTFNCEPNLLKKMLKINGFELCDNQYIQPNLANTEINPKLKATTLKINSNLYSQVKRYCLDNDKSISETVNEAIREYLDRR